MFVLSFFSHLPFRTVARYMFATQVVKHKVEPSKSFSLSLAHRLYFTRSIYARTAIAFATRVRELEQRRHPQAHIYILRALCIHSAPCALSNIRRRCPTMKETRASMASTTRLE